MISWIFNQQTLFTIKDNSFIILYIFRKFFTPTIVGIDKDLATIAKWPSGPPSTLTRPEILDFECDKRSAGLNSEPTSI